MWVLAGHPIDILETSAPADAVPSQAMVLILNPFPAIELGLEN